MITMIRRRAFLGAAATGGLALVAGCTGGSNPGGGSGNGNGNGGAAIEETSSVSMTGSQFDPRNIHVDTGATVTWTNDDGFDHTVTSASDNWDKDSSVAGGEETTHTFEESGVYDVYCTIHGGSDLSGMCMKVGVGDTAIESPLGGGSSGDDDGGGMY
ncbi:MULTISPECIES: plastocyanin/azurin family copper-binding protein [unclassified Haloferax]|uniref:cupredoxin domain-containing protein n=1 Tax=unclassified Haloferax TaxID=2625095 RepID=UPI002876CEEE|nr:MULTISPECIES: plastocyanin/azurin family copper-binding protein [unclassified Haloferax]MDS0243785.1 plastocyanin/azurin family copper-binding protein [Haloferax sp. S2CR25]MDS0446906.1 plastocyanin/azurin family copper-binding protein [Haloferax sp. S2CR25-2]